VLPAIRVRSDIVRKQQAGLGELDASGSPVGGGLYDESGNEHTYRVLADYADAILRAGYDVIVDATFLRRGDREQFAALAADTGARFRILDFAADPETLRARITARAARRDDPSEGTHDVLDWQLAHADALDADELAATVRIDTETETPAAIDANLVARVLGRGGEQLETDARLRA
jgi:predicted kinase